MQSFVPASDIFTKELVWSAFLNGEQVKTNNEPEVHSSFFYASLFANAYIDDVKPFALPA